MSQQNVEVVLKGVDAVNSGDPDAFMACLHPDVEWEESGDPFPGLRGSYRGRMEARKWFEEAVVELWERLHTDVEEITQASDDRVFLGMLITARGRASGVETERRAWQVFWFVDGKIARRQGPFWARDEGLAAAGLSD
jgi:ketosteroid isomerase-like protein